MDQLLMEHQGSLISMKRVAGNCSIPLTVNVTSQPDVTLTLTNTVIKMLLNIITHTIMINIAVTKTIETRNIHCFTQDIIVIKIEPKVKVKVNLISPVIVFLDPLIHQI